MTGLVASIRGENLLAGDPSALEVFDGDDVWQSEDGRLIVATALSPSGIPGGAGGMEHRHRSAHAIADRYRRGLANWAESVERPVAVLVADLDRRRISAATDPAGVHQLYFGIHGGRLLAGNRLATLTGLLDGVPRVREQGIFDYVYFAMVPSPHTIFVGFSKLPAGHVLEWCGSGTNLRRYFEVSFRSSATEDLDGLSAALKLQLGRAVERAARGDAHPGAFLSGGLDSSTVAGLLAKLRSPDRVSTYSIGFSASGYDEMEFARIASRHFDTELHEYYVTPDDVVDGVQHIVAAADEPFGNSSAVPAYFCARLARQHGRDLLLAGDGGDELFAGNSRYAKQLVFERYQSVPAALRRSVIEPFCLRSPLSQSWPLRKASNYVRQAAVPLPDRLQSYNYLHRHPPTEVFEAGFLERIDTAAPLRELRAEYAEQRDSAPVDRMLFLDWKYTLHDNDLVKVNTACRIAGIDVAYPFLDPAVVRFSCQVPANLKMRQGQLRWFYKRAMADFLPPAIIRKKKHGFGLPFGVWMESHSGLQELATSAFDSLDRRGWFARGFLASVMGRHRDVHAAYYGELVWVLLALELWLQQHAPGARA
jgi:asparagine synthase (glutamine-hydrolysing)